MSFYKDLVNGKYNTYEKTASVNEDVMRSALNELSSCQLDALAEELDIFTKEASELDLESSLFEEEEYISCEIGKEASEEEVEEAIEAEETEETEEVEESIEAEETEETEEVIEVEESGHEDPAGEPGEAGYTDETEEVEEIEQEASEEDEFEIVKEACEQVGDYLAENNLTVADYVYSLTGLEKHASHIGDVAEKVAMVYDIPVVMAARDIVNTMMSFVDEE